MRCFLARSLTVFVAAISNCCAFIIGCIIQWSHYILGVKIYHHILNFIVGYCKVFYVECWDLLTQPRFYGRLKQSYISECEMCCCYTLFLCRWGVLGQIDDQAECVLACDVTWLFQFELLCKGATFPRVNRHRVMSLTHVLVC